MYLELHKSKNLLKILNTAIDAGKEIQKVYKKSFNRMVADLKAETQVMIKLAEENPNDIPAGSKMMVSQRDEAKEEDAETTDDPFIQEDHQ